MTEQFAPGWSGYLSYCLGFGFRYLAVGGGAYLLLHLFFRERFSRYRIQIPFPPLRQIFYEIRWSLVTPLCSGAATVLTYELTRQNLTRMYFDVSLHGWGYLLFSALVCLVGYDAWIYWQHRWLHTPWLFQHVHSYHHRVSNPTVFAAFAQHPVETLMGNLYFLLFVVLVPVHPFALAAAGAYMFMTAVIAHAGYEFYPSGFTRNPFVGWINTSTHHNMHHRFVRCNYGGWFNYWDRWMGTNHALYHETFDATRRRATAIAAESDQASLSEAVI